MFTRGKTLFCCWHHVGTINPSKYLKHEGFSWVFSLYTEACKMRSCFYSWSSTMLLNHATGHLCQLCCLLISRVRVKPATRLFWRGEAAVVAAVNEHELLDYYVSLNSEPFVPFLWCAFSKLVLLKTSMKPNTYDIWHRIEKSWLSSNYFILLFFFFKASHQLLSIWGWIPQNLQILVMSNSDIQWPQLIIKFSVLLHTSDVHYFVLTMNHQS